MHLARTLGRYFMPLRIFQKNTPNDVFQALDDVSLHCAAHFHNSFCDADHISRSQ